MRRFLYLNNDSLYSYISQIENGLTTTSTDEFGSSKEKGTEKGSNVTGNVNADLKIMTKGFEANLEGDINEKRIKGETESYKSSVNKQMYDEAFDRFQQHIDENSLLKNKDTMIGDFLKIDSEMFIVDLEYYKSIFSNDDILSYVKEDEITKKMKTVTENTDVSCNGNKATYDISKSEKEIRKQVNSSYEDVKKLIGVIFSIVPYNKFGIMGDNLIVLDDEHFRDKTKVVAYKYGGKMTIVGYLTNIVNNSVVQDDKNIFTTFPTVINEFLLNFFNKSQINIIHPIAIYYG